MKKYYFYNMLTILMVALTSFSFASCGGDDDDDDDVPVPSGLIGTWYKVSGAERYNLRFTFNADGTGDGYKETKNIYMVTYFVYNYKYKSNGDVICDYSHVSVDENGEEKGTGTMMFNYSGGKLTMTKATNLAWIGCVFSKD